MLELGDPTLQIAIAPDLRKLAMVREEISEAITNYMVLIDQHPDTRRAIDDMLLAATELVANVIRHGLPNPDEDDRIEICVFATNPNELVFQVSHSGTGYSVDLSELPELTEPSEGGMGLYIISKCVDQCYHSTLENGRNSTWLIRSLPQHRGPVGKAVDLNESTLHSHANH